MEKEKRKSDEDTIFIGQKPVIVYVNSIATKLIRQNMKEIKITAMGKHISTAVDAVEIAMKNYLTGNNAVEKKSIITGTHSFEDGGACSFIEIVLKKIENDNPKREKQAM